MSFTSEQAKNLNLTYYGFGRYGKNGKVSHEVKFGRLIPVKVPYSLDDNQQTSLKHLEHLEDNVFNHGAEGVEQAIDVLLAAKHADDRILTSIKIDGAPSLVFGKDNKGIFVATKSAFNKNPKINYSHEDIEKNHGHTPGLTMKLKQALDNIPKIFKHGKLQGDVLFNENDKKIMKIDGEDHVVFKPNTITYAIPLNTDLGQKAAKAKFGIAVHSKYDENGNLQPLLNTSTHLDDHPDVFVMPVTHATSHYQNDEFNKMISQIGLLYKILHPSVFHFAKENSTLFKQYTNYRVRDGLDLDNADEFISWFNKKEFNEISKLKTEAAKNKKIQELKLKINNLTQNKEKINALFSLIRKIQWAKKALIDHFSQTVAVKHYYATEHGLEKTGPEGFVIHTRQGPVKMVDRQNFSRQNFNAGEFRQEKQF